MNKFTKEELIELVSCVDLCYGTPTRIADKIQSMIDNYPGSTIPYEIDNKIKICKLCSMSLHSIPCIGDWS